MDYLRLPGFLVKRMFLSIFFSDPNFLCSTFKGDYKTNSIWKRWSVLPINYHRAFHEGKWFRADRGSAMPNSCVLQQSCGVQAPGWLNGQNPSREAGIMHGQVCFNFRKDCCYYSLPVQIKKCSDFFVYKLREVYPVIPGQYCFTTNTLGMYKIRTKQFRNAGTTQRRNKLLVYCVLFRNVRVRRHLKCN